MSESRSNSNPKTGAASSDAVVRRAALVLVSLDDRQAAELMAKMSPRQVEAITAAIENLHEIDPAEQADALREFYGRMGMDRPGSTDRVPPQVETLPALSDDLRDWPADAIRFAFDPASVDDWSLALADTDQEQIRRVLKALSLRDRKLVAESDRRRGPWRLHEPHEARQRIRSRFVESAGL